MCWLLCHRACPINSLASFFECYLCETCCFRRCESWLTVLCGEREMLHVSPTAHAPIKLSGQCGVAWDGEEGPVHSGEWVVQKL